MKIGILARKSVNSIHRLEEEARARGHEVRTILFPECSLEIEQGRPVVRYRGEVLEFDAIIPRIMPAMTFYGTTVVRQFEMSGTYTTASSQAITSSRDKLHSLQLLSRVGVGIPKTLFSKGALMADDAIQQLGVPLIIKLASGTQGHGVVLVETPQAARSVIQAFSVNDANILLQEFIAEAGGADIRVFVVGDEVVASIKRQGLENDFRSNIHQGGKAEVWALREEERQVALLAAKVMGLPVCGVDIVLSERGPLVLEVNASPGLSGIEAATGCNVARSIIMYIERHVKHESHDTKAVV